MVESDVQLAIRAARRAGALLLEHQRRGVTVEHKSPREIVTRADRDAQDAIRELLREARPDDAILAEEGLDLAGVGGRRWIVDPLDGTNNFAHGIPCYCVSIGLAEDDVPSVGVVYDPTRDECFAAATGEGSTLNGAPIHVRSNADLAEAILATGFPYDLVGTRRNVAHFAAFATRTRGLRRLGSAALDLAYVAAGRFDGFWELMLRPWDMTAGAVLVAEAGGSVTDVNGAPWRTTMDSILVANPQLHMAMRQVLAESRSE